MDTIFFDKDHAKNRHKSCGADHKRSLSPTLCLVKKEKMSMDFVGIGEATKILGLSRTSIQKLLDAEKLPAVKTKGGHRRILRSSIEALM